MGDKKPSSPAAPLKNDPVVLTARIGAWQAVLVALITALGGYLAAGAGKERNTNEPKVVPPPEVTTVSNLPHGTDENFELLRDMSIFDLRSWREVPADSVNTRFSPANYINYIHVKKIRPVDKYVAHYSTSGYAVDLRCITHRASVLKRDTSPTYPGEKEYAMEVDVSDVPLNTEFLIVIEATYWNGFQNPVEEWAATYTDDDIRALGELGLIVLLPEDKPFKSYSIWEGQQGGQDQQYISPHAFYADTAGKFLYWSITTRKPRSHYVLRWKW